MSCSFLDDQRIYRLGSTARQCMDRQQQTAPRLGPPPRPRLSAEYTRVLPMRPPRREPDNLQRNAVQRARTFELVSVPRVPLLYLREWWSFIRLSGH